MFSVKVYTNILGTEERIERWLVFETYGVAANCIFTLTGREPGRYYIEDYFEVADIYDHKKGEQIGDEYETDWVLTYLFKTVK
jgi:hypothetical protein